MTVLEACVRVRRAGLDLTSACILLYVPNGGGMSPKSLQRSLRYSRSGICRALDRLERKKLIRRAADHSDGRCVRVELTASGITLKRQVVEGLK